MISPTDLQTSVNKGTNPTADAFESTKSDSASVPKRGGIGFRSVVLLALGLAALIGVIAFTASSRQHSGANISSADLPATSNSSQPSGSGGNASPSGRGKLFDEWLPAVCKPGSINEQGNKVLPNAEAQGDCLAMQGGQIIYFGQYGDFAASKNDAGLFRNAEYAAAQSDGTGNIYLFVSIGTKGVLAPLAQFNFTVNTVPAEGF